ncbi:hypothetical protein Fmac_023274 [Flemingia macrophylla]|uniref:Ribosome biogenesis protein n=1 Tax=Flemingia macrophylla TaxID=520843 RepID=A0ABD1LL62_9FABA
MGKTRSDSKSDKFEKKVQFYSKVKDAVASWSAQKSITKKKSKQQRRQNKKLKAYNLCSLLEFLPEVKASDKPVNEVNVKLNCKSRQKLVLKESARISDVLKDPNFQADPFSTIHRHLQNKQPVVEEQPKKKVKKNGSKKKKKSKALTGLQSMEM